MKKKISVIIPVFNGEKYISETINSVLEQTHSNFELIIINDGSTDNTLEQTEQYKYLENFKIITINNQGASAAKEVGRNLATGDYIQYLDADDILAPEKFEVQINALQNNSNTIAICKTAYFYNEDGYLNYHNVSGDQFYTEDNLQNPIKFLINLYGGVNLSGGMIQPNAFLTPKEIIDKTGPWNTSISPCSDEDGEYFCRIILNSKNIVYTPKILNYYRKFRNKQSLSSIKSRVSVNNLITSTMIKHYNMLKFADQTLQVYIHTATNRILEEINIQCYGVYAELSKRIQEQQKKLTPHLKPKNTILGGKIINQISKVFGWKVAKKLQLIIRNFK